MRKLSKEKRSLVLNALVEGNSINATARLCRVSKLTVLRLLSDVGRLCQDFHDLTVRGLRSQKLQLDEIWSYCGCKQSSKNKGANGHGDAWVWVAIDADTKIVASYLIGNRDLDNAIAFVQDLAPRLANRVQITSDGLRAYRVAVPAVFRGEVDFAMLQKLYGAEIGEGPERKYSPSKVNGTKRRSITGRPDPEHVSTSFAERQNLTMRMKMRRFTRLTNGFSKKLVNHAHAIALHYFHYNFIRRHET
jgi:IS1 family transposase